MSDERAEKRAILWACIALIAFCALTTVALWAWFVRAESPWGWKSFVATVSTLASIVMCVLVWRTPTRVTVGAGIGVMLFSLLRVGLPGSWTSQSYVLFAITAVLLIPLVHAVIILPPARN